MQAMLAFRLARLWEVKFSVMGRRKKCDDDDGRMGRKTDGWDVLRYWLFCCFCFSWRWVDTCI